VEIDYIWGPKTNGIFGIPRYSNEIQKGIPEATFNNITCPGISNPHLGGILKGICLPINGFRRSVKGRIKHIASQGYAFTAPFLRKGPVLLTCHDLIPWTYYKNRTPIWKANVRSIRQIGHIIAISDYTKNELMVQLGIPEDRIHLIPNGVDHEKFHPIPEPVRPAYLHPEDRILLYVGLDERRKNLGVVLRALRDLVREMPDVKLVKVGGLGHSSYREACIKEIDRMGLAKHVIHTGTIADSELLALYNSADAFVFPSLCEGFGLPPLEAMACGCPVIASDRTAIPEVVGDTGILINPEDPQAWHDAMYKVLDEKATRENMKQKSLKRAAMFGWENCARKTLEIYREIEGDL
jgi:glycosyltransferase involved in cell wall biosynthesis